MYYVFYALDKEDSINLRRATKSAHSLYLDTATGPVEVLMSGPTLDRDGQENGSVMILRAPDEQSIRAFFAREPYHLAGLYAATTLSPWLWKRGNPYL